MKPFLLCMPLLLAILAAGCGKHTASVEGNRLPWIADFSQALETAKKQNKIILADFSAKW